MTPNVLTTVLIVVAVFAITAAIARILQWVVHRVVNTLHTVSPQNRAALRLSAQRLIRALTLLAFFAASLSAASLVLGWFEVQEHGLTLVDIERWVLHTGRRILFIVIGSVVIVRAAHLV